MYEVRFVTTATKEFRSLDSGIKRRVAIAIEAMQENPRSRGVQKLRGHEPYIVSGLVHIVWFTKLMTKQN